MATIRPVQVDDLTSLKEILHTIELFPAALLDDMIADYLHNPATEALWFTALANNELVALGYCAPEQLTAGTYNLYAIGVRADQQGRGVGKQMMNYLEDVLRRAGHRLLIVETSNDEAQVPAVAFYQSLGYTHEATLRDFWSEGEDKIIFWKKL
ncbi:MAG: GNAT family N-acetyltransferase [Bacteroidota bacterium]